MQSTAQRGAAANVASRAVSQKIEFLGAFCLVTVTLDDAPTRSRSSSTCRGTASTGWRSARRRAAVASSLPARVHARALVMARNRRRRADASDGHRAAPLVAARQPRIALAAAARAGAAAASPALRSSLFLLGAARVRSSSRACRTRTARSSASRSSASTSQSPALLDSIWNTLWVATVGDARSPFRSRSCSPTR